MQELLRDYLQIHGYWVLFLGTFLEGEAILIFAGFMAFQGYLNIYGVILSALAGSFLGDQAYFYLGRLKGPFLLKVFGSVSRKFRKGLALIERYGNFVAFVSRYTYGFRILLPIFLGMTTYSSRMFLLLNAASAFSWAVVFSMCGFLFGKGASLLFDDIERYEPYLLLGLALLVVCAYVAHYLAHCWRRRKRYQRLKKRREGRKSTRREGEEDL